MTAAPEIEAAHLRPGDRFHYDGGVWRVAVIEVATDAVRIQATPDAGGGARILRLAPAELVRAPALAATHPSRSG